MDGNAISNRVRPIVRWCWKAFYVSLALCVSSVSADSPRSSNLLRHSPRPLCVDEQLIQPIETSIGDTSAVIVRGRSSVIRVEGTDRTATLVVATSDAESPITQTPATAPATQTDSTWLRLQAAQRSQNNVQPTATVTETSPPETIDAALDRRGSISFRKTPISEVVFLLSDLWKINIVAGENVSGDVSGTFHEAPLREVLSAVLTASGYSYQRTGRSLVVLPIDEVGSDNPNFIAETLRLPGGGIDETESLEAAKVLLSERGELRKLGNDFVLVVDTNDRIARVRNLFEQLSPTGIAATSNTAGPSDQPVVTEVTTPSTITQSHIFSGIAYFSPQYTEASEMAESLTTALGDDAVIAVYEEENRIMVKGDAEMLRMATEAIEQLDVPRAQVRITAMIYDVGLNELERLGVDWSQRPHSSGIDTLSPSDDTLVFRNEVLASTGLISDPTVAGAANLAIRTINDTYDAGMLLQALNANAESKLLADPSITVGDRREASIRIVQRIPIIAANPVDNSGVVFSSVQFEDAGVILNVTPRISRDGTIEMQVQPEHSVVVDFINNNPVIDSRTAQTTLRVQDGHMFVLGGLRQKTITETVRGVPFLMDIKHFGKLFRAHDTQVRESELIVFIKPEIVVPCSLGTPRQERAKCVTSCQLGQIAHAEHTPQTPYCRDPYCPNHVPRPRINGGSFDLGLIEGVTEHVVVGESMPTPNEVINLIENEDLQTTPVEASVEQRPVDEHTYLRLQEGLRNIQVSDRETASLESVPQPSRAMNEVQSAKVQIIEDVDPPIHIRPLPSRG
jgi:general secretion pathway protein D